MARELKASELRWACPEEWLPADTTAEIASGQRSPASPSTAAKDTISPPIFAKRLARPMILMKP